MTDKVWFNSSNQVIFDESGGDVVFCDTCPCGPPPVPSNPYWPPDNPLDPTDYPTDPEGLLYQYTLSASWKRETYASSDCTGTAVSCTDFRINGGSPLVLTAQAGASPKWSESTNVASVSCGGTWPTGGTRTVTLSHVSGSTPVWRVTIPISAFFTYVFELDTGTTPAGTYVATFIQEGCSPDGSDSQKVTSTVVVS